MGTIEKGNYTISIIDSTGQFTLIRGHNPAGNPSHSLSSSDSQNQKDAKDIIDLLKAYLLAQRRNTP